MPVHWMPMWGIVCQFEAAFTNPRTMTGAAIKAGSYALAAASTVADFLLRVERAAEERL